jgi:hypothetical protein
MSSLIMEDVREHKSFSKSVNYVLAQYTPLLQFFLLARLKGLRGERFFTELYNTYMQSDMYNLYPVVREGFDIWEQLKSLLIG